jgi:hypothetical protein
MAGPGRRLFSFIVILFLFIVILGLDPRIGARTYPVRPR